MRLLIRLPSVSKIYDDLERRKQKSIDVIFEEVIRLVSGEPLSNEELRRRGHPYSRRRPTNLSPLVHIRTGRLKASIRKNRDGIAFDTGKAPHLKYVTKGTRRMIPRDFIAAALQRASDRLREIWE
ncbi:hypothetical protein J7J18_06910 [bacterium]|nr:hypothetical protein [bacterium]